MSALTPVDYLHRVQAGVDFIEARLDQEFTLADVAVAAGLSQWHFQRIFKALSHETLKTYIRSRRMAASLDALRDPSRRIIDIALAAGFDTQESFTRAFRRAFDITPGQYRRIGLRNRFPARIRFDGDYLRHLNFGVALTPEIGSWAPMRLVGLRTRFFSVDSERNNIARKLPPLWAEFLARSEEIGGRIPGTAYGLIQPIADDSELLEYCACFAVRDGSPPPRGMLAIDLPGAIRASFAHRGEVAALDHTVSYVYSNWLLGSGRRHTGAADVEIYGPEYHPSSPASVIHYAIAVD